MKKIKSPVLSYSMITLSLLLGGCAATTSTNTFTSNTLNNDVSASIDEQLIVTEPQSLAAKGVEALDKNNLELALESFNKALKLKMTDSTLNYLVGLTYHLMAVQGDSSKFALAEEGYKLAIQFDPSNWHAYFQSGLLALDQRDFAGAQEHFAEALLLKNDDSDLMYNMLVSSYYSGDIETAAAMRDRLKTLEPNSSRYLRASALISAALNRDLEASEDVARLALINPKNNQVDKLERRLNDWKRFHATGTDNGNTDDVDQVTDNDAEAKPYVIDENGMVIVDVVIIRTNAENSTSKGVNLLSGLTMQYGKTIEDMTDVAFDTGAQITDDFSRSITRAISIPAIDYSLNIANVSDEYNEVLARPSLTATNGQQSEFFSGLYIQAATAPTGDGDPITFDDDVGVRLAITPELLEDGRIKLDVEAERKFLNTPNVSYTGFTSKLESTRTTVNATVAMNFGETLILSGISEKETQKIRTGVPLLQDIPVLQYLFSQESTVDFTKSVLILLTPRLPSYTSHHIYAQGGSDDNALDELQKRNGEWFEAYTNSEKVLEDLKQNKLYREFRNGDMQKERWESYDGFSSRLRNSLNFLYY